MDIHHILGQSWTFVIEAEEQDWPYFEEIPHCAWPEEDLKYNSNGNALRPFSQNWTYLDIMHLSTFENILIWNATYFAPAHRLLTLQRFQEYLLWDDGSDALSLHHIGRLGLFLMEALPEMYCSPGNVIISSFRSINPQSVAAVAYLFLQRLKRSTAFDQQTQNIITASLIQKQYLQGFPLQVGMSKANYIHQHFERGAEYYRQPF